MPKMRGRTGQPVAEILVENTSPYESRRMVVECDGITTAAYLNDESSPIAAVWIANHQPAPPTTDLSRLNSGRAPVMPVAHTKHPAGRAPLDSDSLTVVWFEEGDGAAVLENGQLLAVIPGWADMTKGMPGYSRDIIGQ